MNTDMAVLATISPLNIEPIKAAPTTAADRRVYSPVTLM
jgi:hypothetical protein